MASAPIAGLVETDDNAAVHFSDDLGNEFTGWVDKENHLLQGLGPWFKVRQLTFGDRVVLKATGQIGFLEIRPEGQRDERVYQEALQRILEMKGTDAIELDLSEFGLTELPSEIGQLTNLQELDLIWNDLTSLPPEIGQLENLQELYLGGNYLTSLPPEIGQLSNLQELWLSSNPLESPPPEIVEQGTYAILAYLREQLEADGSE